MIYTSWRKIPCKSFLAGYSQHCGQSAVVTIWTAGSQMMDSKTYWWLHSGGASANVTVLETTCRNSRRSAPRKRWSNVKSSCKAAWGPFRCRCRVKRICTTDISQVRIRSDIRKAMTFSPVLKNLLTSFSFWKDIGHRAAGVWLFIPHSDLPMACTMNVRLAHISFAFQTIEIVHVHVDPGIYAERCEALEQVTTVKIGIYL